MARVLEDVKADTAAARSAEEKEDAAKEKNGNGAVGSTAKDKKAVGKVDAAGALKGKGEGGKSLALPRSVVDEGVRITKECLDLIVEVE
jgi:hypothetical protein